MVASIPTGRRRHPIKTNLKAKAKKTKTTTTTTTMIMGQSSKVVEILTPASAIASKVSRSVSWNSAAVPAGGGAIFSTAHDVRLHPSSSVQQQILMRSASSTSHRSLYLSLPTTIHNNSSGVNHYDLLSSSNYNCRVQWRNFARDRGGRRVHYPRSKDVLNGKSRSSNINKNDNDDKFDKYSFGDADRGIIETKENKKKILVVGSEGILGKTLVSHFGGNKCNWDVVGADVVALENNDSLAGKNTRALGLSEYICLPRESSLADLTGELFRGVSTYLQLPSGRREKREKDNLFDAIVCASGGWAGDVDLADYLFEMSNTGASGDVDVEVGCARKNADICERMMRMNYYPIVAASQIGRRFMKRGGESVVMWMQSFDDC